LQAAGVTSQTGAIASALMMVAKYYLKLPPQRVAELREMARDLQPAPQSEISQKMRTLLNKLSVPAIRVRLLHLPGTLIDLAATLITNAQKKGKPPPAEAGRLAVAAVAAKIELMLPIRIGNLANLRLDTHLQRFDPTSRLFSKLYIPASEVKNKETIDWGIDPGTGAFIERYLKEFRPLLNPGDSPWLFPSNHKGKAGPLSIDSIRLALTSAIEEHVGVRMHVHAFRAFVAMLVLEDSAEAKEEVRLVLGHKTPTSGERYYAYVKPKHAARRMADILDRAKKSLSALEKPARSSSPAHRSRKKGGKR
jgi:integrase